MSFNSISFFTFLVLVILLYRVLPYKYGKVVLVVASYYFYGATIPWYCLLLFASTITDFFAGQWIYKAQSKIKKKRILWISILVNLGLLFVFKYYDFVAENLNFLFVNLGTAQLPLIDVILPVGISFYTFQTLSYTIDIYRGKATPCKDFTTFSLYVAYFPQLVAGPVERSNFLIPQLKKKHQVSAGEIMHGVERILWGLIKKVVFADRLAVFVNQIFSSPEDASSLLVVLAILAFSMQLYLDFSGYCDIAVGVARLMGVRLSENFNWPFSASNPSDFWNRWNITLTHWFRDYFYNPLGGLMRKDMWRSFLNIMFFFTAVGFWHGANWNFLLFGIYNGLLVVWYTYWRVFKQRKILNNPFIVWLGSVIIIKLTIHAGMFFFRIPDVSSGIILIQKLYSNTWFYLDSQLPFILLALGTYILVLIRGHYSKQIRTNWLWLQSIRPFSNFILLIILLYAGFSYKESFIYFQF